MPGGRPRLYTDHSEFDSLTEAYFVQTAEGDKMPTLAGLCYHLGFEDKESFQHYATYGPEFSRTVKRARMRIEDDRNQRLSNPSCGGIIFDLKHNYGWTDKSQTELSGPDGAPIQTQTKLDVTGMTEEQLRALASIPVQR